MSFILLQMLSCLLLAGLVGAVIGWFFRGGCDNKIKLLNEECEEKIRDVERDWNTKLNYPDEHRLNNEKNYVNIEDPSHADLKMENKNDAGFLGAVATALGTTKTEDSQVSLSSRGVNLSDEKIQLYNEFGVDLENSDNLEDVYTLDKLIGLKSKYVKKLKDFDIHTTRDLTNRLSSNHQEMQKVTKKLNVSEDEVESWLTMSNLLTLPGLDAKEAQLLQKANISTIKDLGKINIYSLYKELMELNEKSNFVKEVPNIKSLELWSKIAKILK